MGLGRGRKGDEGGKEEGKKEEGRVGEGKISGFIISTEMIEAGPREKTDEYA